MALDNTSQSLHAETLVKIAEDAGRQIPPVWPLSSSVAVNPYLGQSTQSLAATGQMLSRISTARVTMPRSWYQQQIMDGQITDTDLAGALAACSHGIKPETTEVLKLAAKGSEKTRAPLPTVADLAAEQTGFDWPGFVAERTGAWAGGYFDAGQAMWHAPKDTGTWAAWRAWATADLSPQIMGLTTFRAHVRATPLAAQDAIAQACAILGLSETACASYFHQLLLGLGGWSQVARYELWKAELAGTTDTTLTDMLAIALTWEAALFKAFKAKLENTWFAVQLTHAEPAQITEAFVIDEILQEAGERAHQRQIAGKFSPRTAAKTGRMALQAAFCIDVRSEVFRRALENTDTGIQTLGFAGFFGLAVKHNACGSDVDELRLPVLLNPGLSSAETGTDADAARADNQSRWLARAERAWGRFRQAAVSCFACVEATGPYYAARLVSDGLGQSARTAPGMQSACPQPDMDTGAQISAAAAILQAMSLTDGFAPVVLLCGHGAETSNNPHASGLQCGACGGYSGEVNARLLAGILNRADVRAGLVSHGISIPQDTVFVAGLHNTTTDDVAVYWQDIDLSVYAPDKAQTEAWLKLASQSARSERMPALPGAGSHSDIHTRAQNWAETRPEWGLAGCRAFVAAPRSQTGADSFDGQVFLHEYDHHKDAGAGYGVLELILTAPVVVASWISLQYYGSSVSPDVFGSGNKLLHNVTGGIGVVEGNGGMLRTGLPLQSVHDGETLRHEPLRLSVYVAAPQEAVTAILEKHPQVRALFDNRWLHLFVLSDDGQVTDRYSGDLTWTKEHVG
ncbi:YbcC family protein [uncultured Roseobacter sp.]|uniref:YbcC family protein n=1 Tax=uncultured Roseobacter sp. TaxID=114847 RepID=UPI002633AA35|nr:DUF2309 domain-containing protein [uncultured Roseobacter sp.]